ncbi:hypothetical protein [Flavobacterium hiemivividum]|nr:hypothetical protein [Flavobacterium hiemivividum]
MTNYPKSIPVLKNKTAQNFINKINANTAKKASIDFSVQAKITA